MSFAKYFEDNMEIIEERFALRQQENDPTPIYRVTQNVGSKIYLVTTKVVEVKPEAPKTEVKKEAPKSEREKERTDRRAERHAPKAEAPKAEAPKAEAPKQEAPKAEAPGSAGQLKLYNVDPKTAAMLMAIVADKLQKPLNELRFISIREVE